MTRLTRHSPSAHQKNVCSYFGQQPQLENEALTNSLRHRLEAHRREASSQSHFGAPRVGIRVNAVAPGSIETDMLCRVAGDKKAGILAGLPNKRFEKPAEVAQTILFLLSACFLNMGLDRRRLSKSHRPPTSLKERFTSTLSGTEN